MTKTNVELILKRGGVAVAALVGPLMAWGALSAFVDMRRSIRRNEIGSVGISN